MTNDEFIIKMLPLVMKMDRRLQAHTISEVDGIWKHYREKCARCQAIKILNMEEELLELSTA